MIKCALHLKYLKTIKNAINVLTLDLKVLKHVSCLISQGSELESHIFSEFKHGFCDKMENKKCKKVVKEAQTAFELLLHRNFGKKV